VSLDSVFTRAAVRTGVEGLADRLPLFDELLLLDVTGVIWVDDGCFFKIFVIIKGEAADLVLVVVVEVLLGFSFFLIADSSFVDENLLIVVLLLA